MPLPFAFPQGLVNRLRPRDGCYSKKYPPKEGMNRLKQQLKVCGK